MEKYLYSQLYEMISQAGSFCYQSQDSVIGVICPLTHIWIRRDIEKDRLRNCSTIMDTQLFFREFLKRFSKQVNGDFPRLTGIVAEDDIAMACAEEYAAVYAKKNSQADSVAYSTRKMIGYCLPSPRLLLSKSNVAMYEFAKAGIDDMITVAQWLSDFYAETLRTAPVDMLKQKKKDKSELIADKDSNRKNETRTQLYVLRHDRIPVAMGMIAKGAGDTSRINLVYTPPQFRNKGYGKALMSGLVNTVFVSGKTPVLYTHDDNIQGNQLYQSLGFLESGRLLEVKFTF